MRKADIERAMRDGEPLSYCWRTWSRPERVYVIRHEGRDLWRVTESPLGTDTFIVKSRELVEEWQTTLDRIAASERAKRENDAYVAALAAERERARDIARASSLTLVDHLRQSFQGVNWRLDDDGNLVILDPTGIVDGALNLTVGEVTP